jgi:hypothetical protein
MCPSATGGGEKRTRSARRSARSWKMSCIGRTAGRDGYATARAACRRPASCMTVVSNFHNVAFIIIGHPRSG